MPRRQNGKLVAAAIVAFWLVMMGLLLFREGYIPYLNARAAGLSPRVMRPSDTWMGVFFGENTRIGFVNINTTPDTRNGHLGVAFAVTAKLRMNVFSTPMEIYIAGSAWIPQDTSVADFDFKVRSSDHSMRVAATVNDGRLDGRIYTGGEVIPLQIPVGTNLLFSGAMGTTTLNIPRLKPGQETVIDAFDPMTFSVGRAHLKCLGEETIEAAGLSVKTKVIATTMNGLTSKAWVSNEDEIVRAETPFGFALRKIAPQEALAPLAGGDSTNLLQTIAVEPTGRKPFRGAKRMVVRLTGLTSDRHPPVDETQTAADNVYTIETAPEPVPTQEAPAAFGDYLKSDPFVQADNSRIKDVALKAAGPETDPWKRALAIYAWVFKNIKKISVFSIPSALDVLETREGDCNEHTVLFTALARAAGIPTRIAIGLTWSDQLEGFYYHAWPEVRVGRWVPMDPTLGQPIADATHLKLLNGGIETWPQLLPYLGQLKIEVLSIE